MTKIPTLIVVLCCFALPASSAGAGETIESRIGKLEFTHDFVNGYPSKESVRKLHDEMDFQRATQAYLWALPLVAFQQWQNVHERQFGAADGDLVLYQDYADKRGLLTANATTPYMLSFIDLSRTGPVVVEMPAGDVRGAMHTMWQIEITSMERPGKYLFVPPGAALPKPDGYIVSRSDTNSMFFGIRLLTRDEAEAKKLLESIRVYPYKPGAAAPDRPGRLIPVNGRQWQGWQPRGMAYWEVLAEAINRNPVHERDRFFIAMLKPLAIEKGKPFKPDARQKKLLTDAALVGEAMAKANDFQKRTERAHYADGRQWHVATVSTWDQRADNYDMLDERAAWFYEAVTNDKGMQSDTPGRGQIYLGTYKDKAGNWLDGGKSYRLRVPANPPAKDFWSVTVYDVGTRALIDNPQKIADRSSRMDLKKNADGSVDLYIGPKAPAGWESNWVPTVPGRAWFSYFRLYGPTQAHFDRTWVLPDFEQVP
jgi:hypothetical protein